MRRRDREITGIEEINRILDMADACRLTFFNENIPYIVCMNYGYQWLDDTLYLYFHCAHEGKKLEMMRLNNYVCFQMDAGHQLEYIAETVYCTMKYHSITGMGYLSEVGNETERIKGLDLLMRHHGHEAPASYPNSSLMRTTVLCLKVTEFTAKSNYKNS